MREPEHKKKGFIHWDDDLDGLRIGRVGIEDGLLFGTGVVLFILLFLGAILAEFVSPWFFLLSVPSVLIFGSALLYGIYRAVKWFVMAWVYAFQPWKRPKREERDYSWY